LVNSFSEIPLDPETISHLNINIKAAGPMETRLPATPAAVDHKVRARHV
jgi:hypothetical protein